MNKSFITIFILFLVYSEGLMAQDCRAQLIGTYQKMADFDFAKGFLIDYTAKVTTSSTVKTEHVKTYGNANKSAVESTDYRLYQDDSIMVSIIEPNKTIFITRRTKAAQAEDQIKEIVTVQDSLLRRAKEVECISGQTDYGTHKYTVTPSDELTKKFLIKDYDIWTDENGQMTRCMIHYNSGVVKSLEMTIHEYRNSFEGPVFSGTALDIVMSDKSVRERYKNYKLIDSRNLALSNVN
ncbi:MAG: hypothetical protein AAF519_00570 [Bacteroidota bacterium]